MKTDKLIRSLVAEVRIIDEARGIVDYVASDETLDSYNEVIRAAGWRFTNFQKNAPFVNSHDYRTIENLLGKVTNFSVKDGALIERVQWAIDVPDAKLAKIGWGMTKGGYLKAVSVGFRPVKYATKWDSTGVYAEQLKELGVTPDKAPVCIYIEHEQIELSSCIIGANPNALAKAYKGGAVSEEDLDYLSTLSSKSTPHTDLSAAHAADAEKSRQRQRAWFLEEIQQNIK